jgi:hypothetical protein
LPQGIDSGFPGEEKNADRLSLFTGLRRRSFKSRRGVLPRFGQDLHPSRKEQVVIDQERAGMKGGGENLQPAV